METDELQHTYASYCKTDERIIKISQNSLCVCVYTKSCVHVCVQTHAQNVQQDYLQSQQPSQMQIISKYKQFVPLPSLCTVNRAEV